MHDRHADDAGHEEVDVTQIPGSHRLAFQGYQPVNSAQRKVHLVHAGAQNAQADLGLRRTPGVIQSLNRHRFPDDALAGCHGTEIHRQDDDEVSLPVGQGGAFVRIFADGDAEGFDTLGFLDEPSGCFVLGQIDDAQVHLAQLSEIEQPEYDHDDQGQEERPEQGGAIPRPHPDGHPGNVNLGAGSQLRTLSANGR